LKGFRSPHLQIDKYRHLEIIRNFNFHYDSSLLFKRSSGNSPLWPFTFNYKFDTQSCINCADQDVAKSIDALWEFPLHEWVHPNATVACRTLSDSSCLPNHHPTVNILYEHLIHNFNLHYATNRAPFIIELDLLWLQDKKQQRLEAIVRFIERLLTFDDIYFVSIEQALEWLKYPRPLEATKEFWAFSNCDDIHYEYDIECSDDDQIEKAKLLNDDKKIKEEDNKTSSPLLSEFQNEQLFRSSLLVHCLWIFLLLVLSVIFYDKYFTAK